jgi:hypothetical protein
MTTNNEAFEKWFSNKLAECRANNDMDMHRNLSRYVGFYKFGFEAAATVANKRIAELEREVAIARSNENHADDQRIKCIRKYKTQITELQVSNNRLRDGIAEIAVEAQDTYTNAALTKLLSATQAESLQEKYNEALEKTANIAIKTLRPDLGIAVAEQLRSQKEVK